MCRWRLQSLLAVSRRRRSRVSRCAIPLPFAPRTRVGTRAWSLSLSRGHALRLACLEHLVECCRTTGPEAAQLAADVRKRESGSIASHSLHSCRRPVYSEAQRAGRALTRGVLPPSSPAGNARARRLPRPGGSGSESTRTLPVARDFRARLDRPRREPRIARRARQPTSARSWEVKLEPGQDGLDGCKARRSSTQLIASRPLALTLHPPGVSGSTELGLASALLLQSKARCTDATPVDPTAGMPSSLPPGSPKAISQKEAVMWLQDRIGQILGVTLAAHGEEPAVDG